MQKASVTYQALKFVDGETTSVEDEILIEAPLQIDINGESFTVVMRTPGADRELVLGLLYSEGVLKKEVSFDLNFPEDDKASITIKKSDLGSGYLNSRSLLSVSSCGICGKRSLKDIKILNNPPLHQTTSPIKSFEFLFDQLRNNQDLFEKTGGSHAAALFDAKGQLLYLFEDIGRHNAVDKITGAIYLDQTWKKGQYLVVSGRVSYEIVSKAFFSKIPFLLSVSACSSMAIDMAKELGIHLVGFNRGNKATFYN
ncbi:formate dehydrogenase accessory sulfurtransferase FdhD [Flavobacteriaceae bacterium]|nr:formate dehydrogenase accessory sulfurtransferase FdhD [Flavobacteriaceae bacterium]